MAGRSGSLFFWRDRTREVDFAVEIGGRLELYEAKWTELPTAGDLTNLRFVRDIIRPSKVTRAGIVCRTSTDYAMSDGFRAMPVDALT
jgi:predicted AAA+ superfamily ATPase